jgi:hypothetical protein
VLSVSVISQQIPVWTSLGFECASTCALAALYLGEKTLFPIENVSDVIFLTEAYAFGPERSSVRNKTLPLPKKPPHKPSSALQP